MTLYQHELKNAYIGEYVENPQDLLSNVIVYYPMKGNLNDTGPNARNMTTTTGSYSGTNYLTFSSFAGKSTAATYSTSQNITVSGRVSGLANTDMWPFVLGWDPSPGRGLVMTYRGFSIVVNGTQSGCGATEDDPPAGGRSSWHMVTFTLDVSTHTAKCYINGELKKTTTVGSGGLRGGTTIGIGANSSSSGATRYVTGNMGITFATQNVMTQSEIQNFYNATKGRYGL